MVDLFALGLAHALLALAAWRMVVRDDLDHDPATPGQGQDGAPGEQPGG